MRNIRCLGESLACVVLGRFDEDLIRGHTKALELCSEGEMEKLAGFAGFFCKLLNSERAERLSELIDITTRILEERKYLELAPPRPEGPYFRWNVGGEVKTLVPRDKTNTLQLALVKALVGAATRLKNSR